MDFRQKIIDFRQQIEELADNFASAKIKEEEQQKKPEPEIVHPTTERGFTIFDRCVFVVDGVRIFRQANDPRNLPMVRAVKRGQKMSRRMLHHFLVRQFKADKWCSKCFAAMASTNSTEIFEHYFGENYAFRLQLCDKCTRKFYSN